MDHRPILFAKFILILLLVKTSHQHGSGAPLNTCQSQMPNHSGGDIKPQTSPSPYTIVTSSPQVKQGETLNVTIRGKLNAAINLAGFILQARLIQNTTVIVGRFVWLSNENDMHYISCNRENDTVTHSNKDNKLTPLTFRWLAPTDFLGSVEFRATVAENYNTFWTNIASKLVEVVTVDTEITTSAPDMTDPTEETNLPVVTTAKAPLIELDEIYQNCGVTKLCLGSPQNCVNNGNCDAIVSVTVSGDVYTFELQSTKDGAPAKYVAAGLSKDNSMGQDSAMECVNDNGNVKMYTSVTCSKSSACADRSKSPQNIVQLLSSSVKNRKLYCKFTRDSDSRVDGMSFDLINDKFFLMVVAGSSLKGSESVGFHDIAFTVSNEDVALAQVANLAGSSKKLVKLHGSFMIFAWVGTASVGILLARYFRQTWVGKQVGGKDVWFAYHRILMVITWVLTVAASVLIALEVGGWATTGNNPHAITGSITVLLCFFQPIGAYFRPHPGTKRRPVFNWLHWLAGNSAYILAMVTIFAAVYLQKAELPSWTVFVMALFVIFHVIMHLVLSLTVCVSEGRIGNGRVNSFPMKDMNQPRPPKIEKVDAPFSSFRRLMLSVYVPVVLIVVILLILLVSLAPIASS